MKSKIFGTILTLVAIAASIWLIQSFPNEWTRETEGADETVTYVQSQTGETKTTRTSVIETAHDAEDFIERLAFGESKSYESTLSDLIVRLENSSEYLKTDLQDYFGATYFSKIADVFRDVHSTPFTDSATFGVRVGKMLIELENAYPRDVAATLNENDSKAPMYYPKFDTDPNGSLSLAMLSIYRQQYAKNTGSILLTFGGNLMMGDTLLGAQDANSFKNLQEKSKYSFPLYRVSSVLNTDSASFANLTSPLTESIDVSTVAGSIKGLPAYASLIKKGGIDVVALSDQRILSYGEAGKVDTANALKAAAIPYSDEGTVAYTQTSLGTVAYLSYNIIDEIKANVNVTYEEAPKNDIAAARERGAKFVIVHFNWYTTEKDAYDPCKGQYSSARAAVDNGANLVIGTSPDAIAAIEQYKGVNIVYAPGNLSNRDGTQSQAFLFQQAFSLDANGAAVAGEIQLLPLSGISENEATPSLILNARDAKAFENTIIHSSRTLKYGVNKRAEFPVEKLNIIAIQK